MQRLRLDVRQRRRRLVHDDHARVTGDGAQDLDLLLVGGAELAGQRVVPQPEAPALDELRVLLSHPPPFDEPATPRLDAEEDVLDHREMRGEGELLRIIVMPARRASAGVPKLAGRPSTSMSPASRPDDAAEDLAQR